MTWKFYNSTLNSMVVSGSPKGPPIGSIYHLYTTYIYILPSGGLYATYHPLGEPETTIDQQPGMDSYYTGVLGYKFKSILLHLQV